MKYMLIARATKDSEAGRPPDPKLMAAVGKLTEEMTRAGVLAGSGGLGPSSLGARVRLADGKVTVTDGPFAETKELVGGYAIVDVESKEQAIELSRRFWQMHADVMGPAYTGEGEIRPLFYHADFAGDAKSGGAARQKGTATATKIFVNLPVQDLNRSIAFFTQLGFTFNPQFMDETATCMIVSDDIFVMLLTEAKFKAFTPKAICDATKSSEVLVALSCQSRDAVEDMVRKAVAAGGSTYAEPKDYGFMYQHGFQDPDGHIWELIYMDPQAIPQC